MACRRCDVRPAEPGILGQIERESILPLLTIGIAILALLISVVKR